MQGKIILAVFVVALFAISESKVVLFKGCQCGTPTVALQVELENSNATRTRFSPGSVPRLVGGTPARRGQHPWNALIKVKYTDGTPDNTCQATLVHTRFVLTSVRCFLSARINLREIQVYLGVFNTDELDEMKPIRATRVTLNGAFPPRPATDLALIQLAEEAEINADVQPICLSDVELAVNGARGIVSGYRKTQGGEILPDLAQFQTTIIPNNQQGCPMLNLTAARQFCAGNVANPGRPQTLCPEDTGSPMIIQNDGLWFLAGLSNIVSAQCNSVFGMLKVTSLINFIRQTIDSQV